MKKTELIAKLLEETSLFDTKTHKLYIPDVSTCPFHVYGIQIADFSSVSLEEQKEIFRGEENLTQYALERFAAPGACSDNRMGFYGFDDLRKTEDMDDTEDDLMVLYGQFLDGYVEDGNSLDTLVTEDMYAVSVLEEK